MENKKAVVLLSGGLDSSTCLYMANAEEFDVITIAFEYDQRHSIELKKSKTLSKLAGAKEHIQMPVALGKIGGSALTDDIEVPKGGGDLEKENLIPVTYVPARNLVFLSLAAGLAEARGASTIFIGANALDYSGYPDCRPDFFDAFTKTVELATREGRESGGFVIRTPLIDMKKREIVLKAVELNVPLEHTWSCYDPQGEEICGQCDSCILRAKGFAEAGILDPLVK